MRVHLMKALHASPCLHCYDDHLTLEASFEAASGQSGYGGLCKLLGTQLDRDKHSDMAPTWLFIGCQVSSHLVFASRPSIDVKPKPGRPEAILSLLKHFRDQGRLTAADAASLRGKTSFLGGQLAGHTLRGCEAALIERQYGGSSFVGISPELELAFAYIEYCSKAFPSEAPQPRGEL